MYQELIDNKADDIGLKKAESEKLYCEFCDNPQDGTFIRTGGIEIDDSGYCICGYCIMKISCTYPTLSGINLGIKIDELYESLPIKLPF